MQTQNFKPTSQKPVDPVEVMETLFVSHQWSFERTRNQGLTLKTTGAWCDYDLHCATNFDLNLFYITCTYGQKMPIHQQKELEGLLAKINREMWMGHFDLCSEDGAPTYRQSISIRGVKNFSLEQMEDMVDHALSECERFYPAFQGCLWGNLSPELAVKSALMECHGMA